MVQFNQHPFKSVYLEVFFLLFDNLHAGFRSLPQRFFPFSLQLIVRALFTCDLHLLVELNLDLSRNFIINPFLMDFLRLALHTRVHREIPFILKNSLLFD